MSGFVVRSPSTRMELIIIPCAAPAMARRCGWEVGRGEADGKALPTVDNEETGQMQRKGTWGQMEKALLVDRKFKQALRLFEQANTVRRARRPGVGVCICDWSTGDL